jgi:Arc/MetJ-type ribon-helix-helix transcriptional regulator
MKKKISVSVDAELIPQLEQIVSEGLFRNKSHLIEFAVKDYIKQR